MLLFHAISHCSFISLSICFLMKLMIVLFLMSIVDLFHVTSLINWFAASFLMMFLQLDTYCMQIWHWFCCKLIRFCRMLLNNFKLTLLFAFSSCSVIWLSVYTQISLSSNASLLYIAIASLIACNFAFIMIILLITLVILLHLTDSCVNIIAISISVLSFAIFFRVCDALMFFFLSSLSACSLWLWHCLDAVYMLNYMYLDQSHCFISFHWSITSIVCANKCFQSNNFFLSCSRFLASSYSFHSTLLFSIVVFLLQFKYFSSTLALRFFQSWW